MSAEGANGTLLMTRRSSGRSSIGSVGSDFGGSGHLAKRSRQGSISGRLRTASDLEDMGWITSSQKGVFKDLIISDDPVLRTALDKYESGNVQELKGFIRRGSLSSRRQSIDLLDTLDLDFLNVKFPTTDVTTMINSNENGVSYDPSGLGFGTFDDYFPFPEDVTHARSATRRTNSLLGTFDGHLDLDEGGGEGGMLPGGITNFGSGSFTWLSAGPGSSGARKMSLTLPGEVPMSAYENMALSLQKKPKGQGQMNKRDSNGRGGTNGIGSPSSQTAKQKSKPRTGTGTGPQNPVQKTTTNGRAKEAIQGGNDGTSVLETMPSPLPAGFIGVYSPEARRERIAKFLAKRDRRVWTKKVKYDVRKNFADSRIRVKGRFVKKEDEENMMRDLLDM